MSLPQIKLNAEQYEKFVSKEGISYDEIKANYNYDLHDMDRVMVVSKEGSEIGKVYVKRTYMADDYEHEYVEEWETLTGMIEKEYIVPRKRFVELAIMPASGRKK